jgi:hypothetical protein
MDIYRDEEPTLLDLPKKQSLMQGLESSLEELK